MRAHPGRAPNPAVDADRHLDPEPPCHLVHLGHRRPDHLGRQRRFGQIAEGRASQGAHRIEDGVAQQLHPELVSDLCLYRRLEARVGERGGEPEAALALASVRLAQGEPIALHVPDDARGDEIRGRIDDAPDHPHRIDRPGDESSRVDGFQVDPLQFPTVALEVPPWDPVLRADNRRLLAERRAESLDDRREAVGLERNEDGIGGLHDTEVIRARRVDRVLAARFDDAQALLAHRLEVRTAGDQGDVFTGARQSRAEKPPNRPGAQDDELHLGANCSATKRRCTFPVGVRGIASTM